MVQIEMSDERLLSRVLKKRVLNAKRADGQMDDYSL